MAILSRGYDEILEYLVHAILVVTESSVCWSLYQRYKKGKKCYTKKIFLLHLTVLFGIMLGVLLTTVAYTLFPDDYNTLLSSALPAYETGYLTYRYLYFVQLITYQLALFGLFLVDYQRYVEIYELIKDKKIHLVIKGVFSVVLIVALGYISYNHLSPQNREEWQALQASWNFHYVHAIWFYLVCLSGVVISVSCMVLIYNWKLNKNMHYKDITFPLKLKVIVILDFIQITIAFLIHFFTFL
ncbi:hypothetical protein HDV06_006268 [Boothiomyces sp. JEL0866]|nr:hypothetical protein HDV06_006268 [Boothiomyces sp. JEL0866]